MQYPVTKSQAKDSCNRPKADIASLLDWAMVAAPQTRYVKSGDVYIAYQVIGDGPLDIVFVPGFVSNLEATWDSPARANFFNRLASFSRLLRSRGRKAGASAIARRDQCDAAGPVLLVGDDAVIADDDLDGRDRGSQTKRL